MVPAFCEMESDAGFRAAARGTRPGLRGRAWSRFGIGIIGSTTGAVAGLREPCSAKKSPLIHWLFCEITGVKFFAAGDRARGIPHRYSGRAGEKSGFGVQAGTGEITGGISGGVTGGCGSPVPSCYGLEKSAVLLGFLRNNRRKNFRRKRFIRVNRNSRRTR
jgi:hypothetical protein